MEARLKATGTGAIRESMSEGNEPEAQEKKSEDPGAAPAPAPTDGAAAPAAAAPLPEAESVVPPTADPPAVTQPSADVAAAPAAPPPAATGGEPAVASAAAAEEEEEVVPEEVPAPKPSMRVASHHPPPPPRLRAGAGAVRAIQVTGDPKLARDLMTRKLFTVSPTDPIEALEGHMATFHFRHLPVVDGDKVVGLISHGDLLHSFSSFLSMSAKAENAVIGKLPAARVMQREFVTARPDEPLSAVAERLWSTRAEAVLVTEEGGKLVGILTQGDFVRLAHHLLGRAGGSGAAPA